MRTSRRPSPSCGTRISVIALCQRLEDRGLDAGDVGQHGVLKHRVVRNVDVLARHKQRRGEERVEPSGVPTISAMTACPKLPTRESSLTTTSRPERATDPATVPQSHGAR